MDRKISYSQAQDIIDFAGKTLEDELVKLWAEAIVRKDIIVVSETLYYKIMSGITSVQKEVYTNIFGELIKFKPGEWVRWEGLYPVTSKIVCLSSNNKEGINYYKLEAKGYELCSEMHLRRATAEEINLVGWYEEGTPCVVRNTVNDGWHLRYACGKGGFYQFSKKDGTTTKWVYHAKLNIDNLPIYEQQ